MNRHQQSPEYVAWKGMKYRCNNPRSKDYPNYGARGIGYDPKWEVFNAFLQDMGPRPSSDYSLDRKNTDGPYTKTNCRWATHIEQQNNRTNNLKLSFGGVEMTASQFARLHNLPRMTVVKRIRLGWDLERIASTPNNTRK